MDVYTSEWIISFCVSPSRQWRCSLLMRLMHDSNFPKSFSSVKFEQTATTYAVKKEKPANLWECYILKEVHRRIQGDVVSVSFALTMSLSHSLYISRLFSVIWLHANRYGDHWQRWKPPIFPIFTLRHSAGCLQSCVHIDSKPCERDDRSLFGISDAGSRRSSAQSLHTTFGLKAGQFPCHETVSEDTMPQLFQAEI